MQWMGRRESSNAEEGSSSGGGRMALGGGVLGIIGVIIYMFTGVNPSQILQGGDGQTGGSQQNTKLTESKSKEQSFARVVLADTEDTWHQLFKQMGGTYQEPTIHFFEGQVETSGCGFAGEASGPFYCPADRKVYIDLTFFNELEQRFGAAGDFARAYVIAHEVGHHVQKLLGVSDKMQQARQQLSEEEYTNYRSNLNSRPIFTQEFGHIISKNAVFRNR